MYSRTPVTRTLKGHEKQFELAGVRVIGVDWIFNLPCLKQKKKTMTKRTATEITRTGYSTKKESSSRSIVLCVLRDACHELFCVFGDFYASGTQDAEVTKSLLLFKVPIGSLHDLITWPTFGRHENSSSLKNYVSTSCKSILKLGNLRFFGRISQK